MAKNKNCPNCGAPYEIDKNKCPYCGTSYYDLSAIDFTKSEPFYLKIKTGIGGKSFYVTQLVKPQLGSFNLESNSRNIYGGLGNPKIASYITNQSLMTDLSFIAIVDKDTLMTVELADD